MRAHIEVSDATVQHYARFAGVLFLITMIAGFFGEVYVPSRLVVPSDAMATAHNLTASSQLFRLGFASYLIEAVCDVALSWILYVLLRPVNRDLSLLAAFFGLVSTSLYGVAEVFYFAPSLLLDGAEVLHPFSADQVNALVLLSQKLYGRVGGMFMVFYGIAAVVRGYLIVRSSYLPKALGRLFCVAGAGFIVRNVALVLVPVYASDVLLLPMFIATVSMTCWLFVRGIDMPKWDAAVASERPRE